MINKIRRTTYIEFFSKNSYIGQMLEDFNFNFSKRTLMFNSHTYNSVKEASEDINIINIVLSIVIFP